MTFLKTALFACLVSLVAAGCKEDKEVQLAKCQMEAKHLGVKPNTTVIIGMGEPLHTVSICMKAAAYELHVMDERCGAWVPMDENPSCWQSMNWLRREMDEL